MHFLPEEYGSKFFSKKNVKTFHCNIKSLKTDKDVVESYSDSLDQALEDFSIFSDVNELSKKITISIQSSCETHIPPKNVPQIINPRLMKLFSVL